MHTLTTHLTRIFVFTEKLSQGCFFTEEKEELTQKGVFCSMEC